MSAFTPEQLNEMAALFRRETEPLATLIRQLQTGDVIGYGAGSVNFTASQYSAVTVVNHGLPVEPQAVLITPVGNPDLSYQANAYSANTFSVSAFYAPSVLTGGPYFFCWLAIG